MNHCLTRLCFPLALLALLAGGCATPARDEALEAARIPITTKLPALFSEPGILLLTHATGYSAHLETGAGPTDPDGLSGELLVRGNKLFFQPDAQRQAARRHSAGLSILWDTDTGSGFLLSEALQGYAPVSSPAHYTNVVLQAADGPEKLAGHPCRPMNATVTAAGGATATFRLWQAMDLNDLPVQILASGTGASGAFHLTEFRPEPPAASLFRPPEGFTKYDSVEAMLGEMRARLLGIRPPNRDWEHPNLPTDRDFRPPRY